MNTQTLLPLCSFFIEPHHPSERTRQYSLVEVQVCMECANVLVYSGYDGLFVFSFFFCNECLEAFQK